MTCVSLFSGAGISDVGFHRAGLSCLAQVEIDRQANAVRMRHFPDAQHFSDIKEFDAKQFRGVDCVFGGFPCQDYSVAGKRGGIRGDRGALWWELHRVLGECRPPFIGLENVPGLLSSGDGWDFYYILDSLVELGYSVAWRVLNLRYFRVPQRRRRVLIVGSLGSGRAGAIQLEPESVCGDFASRFEEREEDPGDVAPSISGGSGRGWTTSLDNTTFIPYQGHCLMGKGNDPHDPTMMSYVASTLNGSGAGTTRPAGNANELDYCVPICDVRRGAHADPDRPSFGDPGDPSFGLLADKNHGVAIPFAQNSRDEVRDLGDASGAIAAEPGMKQQTCLAFTCKDSGSDTSEVAPTLRAMPHGETHANGGGQVAIQHGWRVRRLTPVECERLMGLPDDFTRYTADGQEVNDGPRYRMLGNGWSVPQAEWLARRIAEEVA